MSFNLGSNKNSKNLDSLFQSTDPSDSKERVYRIHTDNLHNYFNQPLPMYEGHRLDDLVASIEANGIMQNLIVRPLVVDGAESDTDYEILDGRHRRKASVLAGLEYLPCVIKRDLTEDDVQLIVTETILLQRSLFDLSYSQRAAVLATRYNATKNQGKRTDLLIKEINELLESPDEAIDNKQNRTSEQIVTKSGSKDIVGKPYNLDGMTVYRYIQLNKLVDTMKEMVDNEEIPWTAGSDLGHLSEEQQVEVYAYITDNEVKITCKQAKALKQLAKSGKWSVEAMTAMFEGKKKLKKSSSRHNVTIKRKSLDVFFTNDETEEEIQTTIVEALSFYYANVNKADDGSLEGI